MRIRALLSREQKVLLGRGQVVSVALFEADRVA
jgi:hypothetical protein